MAKTRGLGTTLSFTPAGGTEIVIGRLSSIGEISPDSEELDVTTLDSTGGYREYLQGFKDSGELEVSGYHDSGDAGQTALRAAYASGASGTAKVAFPDGTEVSFTGYVKAHTIGDAPAVGVCGSGLIDAVAAALTGPNILPQQVLYFAVGQNGRANVWGWIGGHCFCY